MDLEERSFCARTQDSRGPGEGDEGRGSSSRVRLETPEPFSYPLVMANTLEELAEEALGLPAESRARLADLLVESLDAGDLGHIDRMWADEAKRRRDEVRNGRVETIPGDEALRRVRDAIRR
jgi:hypothetical protein